VLYARLPLALRIAAEHALDGNVLAMRITYNKLVRDQIPEIIQADGHRAVIRILDQESYRAALLEKLAEEAQEAREAPAELLDVELADVLEVLQAIAQAHDLSWNDILEIAKRKRAERGAFENRIFLEYVD
jgi:predicted house-cleaning noncanonical NTP pyrophosphatase (MazG superfamily)